MEARGFLEGSTPTAWVRAFKCNSVFVTRYRSMRVPVSIRTSCFMADKQALVDSGATNNLMSPVFARKMGLGMKRLGNTRKIFGVDDTENKSGSITHYLDLDGLTKGIHQEMRFLVADLGREEMLLGYPWLATFEPSLHWQTATIHEKILPIVISSVNPRRIPKFPVIATIQTEEEKTRIMNELAQECTIRGVATELDIQANKQQVKAVVPVEYSTFSRLFSEEASQRFPPSRPWDHAIELKPNTPDTVDCKVYPMAQHEDKALEEFIDEQLSKGYICPSKSQYASSFFFIKKKDGKLHPVQDYRCINGYTICNQYLLPLISDLITDLRGASIFSKLDVRWGYNNVRIKEGDEHKAAFKTSYGLFEPTVMFFGLCNSPATFQTMMNQIYNDIITKHAVRGTIIRIYMDLI